MGCQIAVEEAAARVRQRTYPLQADEVGGEEPRRMATPGRGAVTGVEKLLGGATARPSDADLAVPVESGAVCMCVSV